MNSNAFHISELLQKHLQNRLSSDEQEELRQWIAASEQNKLVFQELANEEWVVAELDKFSKYDIHASRQKINDLFSELAAQPIAHRVHFLKTSWFRYAAAVILL